MKRNVLQIAQIGYAQTIAACGEQFVKSIIELSRLFETQK